MPKTKIKDNISRYLRINRLGKRRRKKRGGYQGAGIIEDIGKLAAQFFGFAKANITPKKIVEFAKETALSVPEAIRGVGEFINTSKQALKDAKFEVDQLHRSGLHNKAARVFHNWGLFGYGLKKRRKHKKKKKYHKRIYY